MLGFLDQEVAAGVVAGNATLAGDFAAWMASLKTKINGYLT